MVEHGAEGCNYLLAVDVDMDTVAGYEMSSWERGYGDFVMKPDFDTLRPIPWHEGTVLLMADLGWEDGSDVVASPRQILRRQLDRLGERGWRAMAGTELEFIVFRDTYEEAWKKGYTDLDPANLYNVDYSMLGTARVEPLIRRIRNSMMAAGMPVENSKGECNFGQHEINFHYADALSTSDDHVIYKNGAKEIAAQEGVSITFMAKFNEREGNSCHIHCSVAREDGQNLFADEPQTFDHFLAGQLAALRELTLFFAPHINSYKRFAPGSFAPTAVAWGHDNRTCSLRVVGHGQGKRLENRMPGADVNPYLALAAMIAAGLHGVDSELPLEAAARGQRLHRRQAACAAEHVRRPRPLRRQRDRPRGLRPGGRRPLPQPREHRARRARGDGHRLGARSGLRATLMPRPVIGITAAIESARWTVWEDVETNISQRSYSAAVTDAGALPVLLPANEAGASAPDEVLDLLDGLILAGGADLDPAAYGAIAAPSTIGFRAERDRFELALARAALARDLPLLGICRGMQLLNVARGGTLDQHLADLATHLPYAGPVRRPRGQARARLAGGGRGGPRARLGALAPSSGPGEARRGRDRERLGGPGRGGRGDRDDRAPVGAGDPLARRGGAAERGDRGAGGGGAPAGGSGVIAVVEPATEQVMAEVPRAGVEETDAAVAAAKAAFPAWRAVSPG